MILKIDKNTVIAFDLDDTLYKEIDFVKSGFKHIVNEVLNSSEDSVVNYMMNCYFETYDVFEKFIDKYKLSKKINKSELIELYREHIPSIKLKPGVLSLIRNVKKKKSKLSIITDGRSVTQRNKIRSLGIEKYFDVIIISDEIGSEKPSSLNYTYLSDIFPSANFTYIGDNLDKDFLVPNRLGWNTICVLDKDCVHKQNFNLSEIYLAKNYIQEFSELMIEYVE